MLRSVRIPIILAAALLAVALGAAFQAVREPDRGPVRPIELRDDSVRERPEDAREGSRRVEVRSGGNNRSNAGSSGGGGSPGGGDSGATPTPAPAPVPAGNDDDDDGDDDSGDGAGDDDS